MDIVVVVLVVVVVVVVVVGVVLVVLLGDTSVGVGGAGGWWGFDSRELVLKETAGLSGAGSPPEPPTPRRMKAYCSPLTAACMRVCISLFFPPKYELAGPRLHANVFSPIASVQNGT